MECPARQLRKPPFWGGRGGCRTAVLRAGYDSAGLEIRLLPETLKVQCCIAGGGPAGMMLGYLLGRAGVRTVVLEKHPDFLRDFRGDTVHPSTMQIMQELGLLDDFLKLPHSRIKTVTLDLGDDHFTIGDFTR